jgi:glycosyltransferase involved in cell wall biosynthesis
MAKIVYLSSSTIPSRTANSVHVMKMCQAFADNGHRVELLAPERPDDAASGTANAFAFYSVRPVFELTKLARSRYAWGTLQYAYKAARHAKRAAPDIAYGRDVQACYQAAMRGLPVVFEVHDLGGVTRAAHHRLAFSMLVGAATFQYLVVISRALAADVVAFDPRLEGRVRVAHDGADPVTLDRESAAHGAGHAELRAGYIGNIYAGRGLELLEAIAARLPWLELHVVGRWDGKQHAAGAAQSLPSNIHLHGFLPYADAERVRLSCDVLLAPYQRQVRTHGGSDTTRWMSPLKIFEYMAAGKAIVCSDIAVLHEVLEHDKTALLCPPDDVEAWCASLTALRADAALRNRLGAAAQTEFLRLHTWKSRAAAVLEAP